MSLQCDNLSGELQDQWSSSMLLTPPECQENMSMKRFPPCKILGVQGKLFLFYPKHRLWVLIDEAVLTCTQNQSFEQKY